MAATKAKAKRPTLAVPQSDEEADALLKAYGEEFNELTRIGADLADAAARAKAEFEIKAAPIKESLLLKAEQLAAFAAAHRTRLTGGGKTKTVTLPAGTVGWRNKPKSVRFGRGIKPEDIVENIKAKIAAWRATRRVSDEEWAETAEGFIRTKEEPDKEAMLKDAQIAAEIEGIRIGSAGEEFYIAPFGADLAEVSK